MRWELGDRLLERNTSYRRFLKLIIPVLFLLYNFQRCDIVKSDRVNHEECPKVFYKYLVLLSLVEQNSLKTSNPILVNPPIMAYGFYTSCFNQFGGTLLTPLDDLLWNGCGRCYK